MVARKACVPARGTYAIGYAKGPFNPTVGGVTFEDHEPRNSVHSDKKEKDDGYAQLLKNNDELEDCLRVASLATLAHVH